MIYDRFMSVVETGIENLKIMNKTLAKHSFPLSLAGMERYIFDWLPYQSVKSKENYDEKHAPKQPVTCCMLHDNFNRAQHCQ